MGTIPFSRIVGVTILSILIIATGFTGCGGILDQEKTESGKTNGGSSLRLTWPDGFSYDPATKQIGFPSDSNYRSHPVYVKEITLALSSEGEETLVLNVPLDSLSVKVTLTSGVWKMALVVETDIGVTFTGVLIKDIVPGVTTAIVFPLEINAPPVIESIDISNSSPDKNETVTFTPKINEMDSGDELIFSWLAVAPDGARKTGTKPVFRYDDDMGGRHNITLAVRDGNGGVATKTVFIDITNLPPVIEQVTVTPFFPRKWDILSGAALASDPDDAYESLTFKWFFLHKKTGEKLIREGQDVVFGTIKHGGAYIGVLEVSDESGGVATKSITKFVPNDAPVISTINADVTTAKPGDTVNLSCDGTDSTNDPLKAIWENSSGSVIGEGLSLAHTFKVGDESLACLLTDNDKEYDSQSVCINSCQTPANATTCSNNFGSGEVKISAAWSADVDIDLSVTDPSNVKTWYGNIRPGNSSELCVDVECTTTPGTELIYWVSGSTPATGGSSTYTVTVQYVTDCSNAGSASYTIDFDTSSNYQYSSISGGTISTSCSSFPLSSCSHTTVITQGSTDTYTFTLQ